MAVKISDNIGIDRKFVNSERNETGGVGIPVAGRIKFGENLPERSGRIIRIALSKNVNWMKVSS